VTVIKDKIQELKKQISEMELVEKELNHVKLNKEKNENQIKNILVLLEKKNIEIDKLLSFSLTGAISSIFIDKKKTLEEKRNEYYELSKQYEKLKSESSTIKFEYDILNKKIIQLTGVKKELEALLEKREYELLNENSAEGNTLRKLSKDMGYHVQVIDELEEAIKFINRLLNKLTLLSASLQEIESLTSWSRPRIRRSSTQKRKAIANAKEYNIECKLLLNNLDAILRNLNYTATSIDLNLMNFESFLGIFFDNIFSDIILQNKISVAISDVERVYQKLKRIKKDLEQQINKNKISHNRILEARKNLLLS